MNKQTNPSSQWDCTQRSELATHSSRPLLHGALKTDLHRKLPEDKSPFQFSLHSERAQGMLSGGTVEIPVEIKSLNQHSSFH